MAVIPTGQFTTNSAEATFEFAYDIGERLTESTVFLLQGDLGAGKTVFAKGIAAGLDIDPAEVNSPTFTLINAHQGRMKLYHLDLYRLGGSLDEVYALGLEEMLREPQTVTLIEWPQMLGEFAVPNAYQVSIHDLSDTQRSLTISHSIR